MSSTVKIRFDPDACVGHGRCYMLAPDVYAEDAQGHCKIAVANVPPELEKQARMGEANCPEGAIEIEEE
jgi:ferredoxin